jgi:hypothetical protein
MVNLLFPAYIVLGVFVKLAKSLFDPSPDQGLYNFLLFEQTKTSFLGSLGRLIEIMVILYVFVTMVTNN